MSKRQIEESKENLESVDNKAPGAKYQTSQQVQNTMDGAVDAGESSGFKVQRKSTPGGVLKTEVAAKTVSDKLYGGVESGDGLNAAGRAVGGNAGGILGAANMTPVGAQSRRDTRYGKKLDRNSTKLNFIPNEQVLEEYAESKPLAEAKDADQGFNGTYRNEFARSQKKVGNVPAELMFSRSLDLIEKDQVYIPQGQYIKQTGVVTNDEPTYTAYQNSDGQWVNPQPGDSANYDVKRGNYLNRSATIYLDVNGEIRAAGFDTRDLTPTVDAEVANKSSSAALRARNRAELDRETMDSKAGDEKADIWTPLARAVRQPTQTVAYLRDIEAMTGSEIATAYKKATTSHSFQLNRAHKDGQSLLNPMYDAFDGMYSGFASDAAASAGKTGYADGLFNTTAYGKGSAAAMIAAYDSTTKYKSKADILIQPRSLRMHLQTADNNIDPFRVPREFVQIYDNQEVFSTIDREYDPLQPICMTDKAALLTSLSYGDLYSFIKQTKLPYAANAAASAGDDIILIPASFCAKATGMYLHLYAEKTSNQTTPSINGSGVITINNNVGKDVYCIVDTSSSKIMDSDNYIEANPISLVSYASSGIKVTATTRYFSIECVGHDKIFPLMAGPFRYLYSDLRNHYCVTVDFPLLKGVFDYLEGSGHGLIGLATTTKTAGEQAFRQDVIRKGWTIPMIHSTRHFSLWSFIVCAATPYIVNARINSMRDVLYYEKNIEYPFSDLVPIKEMTTRGYTNFNYTDYDHELETKVMDPTTAVKWVFPEFFTKIGHDGTYNKTYVLCPWYKNENGFTVVNGAVVEDDDASCMSMPSIRSGHKLAALDSLYGMSEKDIRLSLDCISSLKPLIEDSTKVDNDDQQFGAYKYGVMTDGIPYFAMKDGQITVLDALKLPRELGFVFDAPYGLLTPNVGDSALSDPASAALVHGTSHRVTYWIANGAVKFTPGDSQAILDKTGVNVNRAANFHQVWFTVYANGKQAPFDHGMVMSVNALSEDDGDAVTGASQFSPFTDIDDGEVSGNANLVTVVSRMKALWTRIQKLPFVISPFDALSADSTRTVMEDPFELAYYFGLCGFRASDYRESVYNREKEVINQGTLFVTDPWINDSPLFKEGAQSSGLALSTGYAN